MAELTPKEHLQPSLLDRLTDLNPASKTDTLEERVMSLRRLRESVIRDLEWLLNTGRLEIRVDLAGYPEVRSSVLNYGIPDITGASVEQQEVHPDGAGDPAGDSGFRAPNPSRNTESER